jgi:GxxExxY protein
MVDINLLTEEVIGAAIEVHRELGPGLLESTYLQCLCRELRLRNISFQLEVPVPVRYKGELLDCGYRMDLLVEGNLIVELKSIEKLLPIHQAQLLTYLKLSGHSVGLLINFNVEALRIGLKRVVNNLAESASAPSAPLR